LLLSRVPRRTLLVSSAFIMAVAMTALGFNVAVIDSMDDGWSDATQRIVRALPVVEIVVYMLSFGFGVGTVPWLLLGELCPARVKGLTSAMTVCVAYTTIFLVVKLFPAMTTALGAPTTYWLFAAACVAIVAFTLAFVPETRGKTLVEIEQIFEKKEIADKDEETRLAT
jgi:hypothetical protein